MRKSSKLLFAGLTAAFILSLAVSSAFAGHFRVSEQRFDAKWTSLEFTAGEHLIRCPVTLEGSFHSATINKVEGALIGHITRASVTSTSCTGGSATVLRETLPWPILYNGFTGTLPTITSIRVKLIRASFQVQPTGSPACLAETTTTNPAKGEITIESRGAATSLTAEPLAEIPLRGGLFEICRFGGEGHFGGTTSSLTALGSTARITVTLI